MVKLQYHVRGMQLHTYILFSRRGVCFNSEFIGACPVATDSSLTMSQRDNSKQEQHATIPEDSVHSDYVFDVGSSY